jgi:hypothetical protein
MTTATNAVSSGFTSVRTEQNLRYLIWVLLLCIVATLSMPTLARGQRQPDSSMVVISRLHSLRTAIETYWVQHGAVYPGEAGLEQFLGQLMGKTDLRGRVGKGPGFVYGPYLRSSEIPDNPVAYLNGIRIVPEMPDVPTGREAWVYCPRTGEIRANSTGTDDSGTRFFDL